MSDLNKQLLKEQNVQELVVAAEIISSILIGILCGLVAYFAFNGIVFALVAAPLAGGLLIGVFFAPKEHRITIASILGVCVIGGIILAVMIRIESETYASFFGFVAGIGSVIAVIALIAIVGLIAQASNENKATVNGGNGTTMVWIGIFAISLGVWFFSSSIAQSLRPTQPLQVAEITPEKEKVANKPLINSPEIQDNAKDRGEGEQNERELQKQAQAARSQNAAAPPVHQDSSELRFLREKYVALTRFKSDADFAEWGFALGGPYGTWLKEMQATKNASLFESKDVAFATVHLLTLGLEYKDSKGKETEYANFANACIRGILDGQSKDAFEKLALEKIESILGGSTRKEKNERSEKPRNQLPNAEYKYVEDDLFPDVYAFHSVTQFRNYWEGKKQNPNLTPRERIELGIELVESRTRILIVSRIPYSSITIFEFEPTTGRNKGKRLFTSSLDVYDSLR